MAVRNVRPHIWLLSGAWWQVLIVCGLLWHIGCSRCPQDERARPVLMMIQRRMVATAFPEGASEEIERRVLEKLNERAKKAELRVGAARGVWAASGRTPEEYQQAAMTILEDMELNHEEWLTLGNIVRHLGVPTVLAGGAECAFGLEGGVPRDRERYYVVYPQRLVKLVFCASGFLAGVYELKDSRADGRFPIYWPHDYHYAPSLPLRTGSVVVAESELLDACRDVLTQVEAGLPREGEGVRLDMRTTPDVDLGSRKGVSVILVDGITPTIVQVFLVIRRTMPVHGHTWWIYEHGWRPMTFQEASARLMRLK